MVLADQVDGRAAVGPANWALPGWLDRILPRLAVEAR